MNARFLNAVATHHEVMAGGLPSQPLDFPPPTFTKVNRVNASIYNPDVDDEIVVPDVIYEVRPDGGPPERAYWIGRQLKRAIYGCVCSCSVLKLREGGWAGPHGNSLWELTPELAAVKIIDLDVVRNKKDTENGIAEDPIKEVAAMQYHSRDGAEPNVLPCWDVFKDEHYIYMCMPLCSKGELFEYVKRNGKFDEAVAKYWFKQLLNALVGLQKRGITHRDISLENILIDENTHALVIDLGMCLRVPYNSHNGHDAKSDSTLDALRLPLVPQGRCGKPNYISPEVLANNVPFDGFAIDLWAAGIVLFIMLVGIPPFTWADMDDKRFRLVTKGGLGMLLEHWKRPISPHAADLLQSMLRCNPSDRLTIYQVLNHPWMLDDLYPNSNRNGSLIQAIERMSPPVESSEDSSNEMETESQ